MAEGEQVYSMMAKIGLDSTLVMAGLAMIGSRLLTVHKDVEALGYAFKGLAAAFGAYEIIKGLEGIAKAGGEVNHQINLMKNIGMTMSDQDAFMKKAQEISLKVPTTTLSENLKHLQELRYIFGGPKEAEEHLESLSRINSVISNIKGGGKDQIFDLAKALEIKNETVDPKEFVAYSNAMLQVIQASGGQVTASDFRNAIQYGRVGAQGWDKEFISGPLARMIQEYKSGGGSAAGGGPGNALMSLFNAAVSGTTKKEAAETWDSLGFGNIKGTGISADKGRDLLIKNPYEWIQQYLVPAFKERDITGKNDIVEIMGKLFQNRTAAGIAANMVLGGRGMLPGFNEHGDPNSPFEKDMRLNKMAVGESAFDSLKEQDYNMLMQIFSQQFHNLLQVLGSEMMQPGGPVIRGMSALASALTSVNAFFIENPKFVQALEVGLAALAAGLAGLAVSAVVTVLAMLAPTGLAAVGLAGLAGALTTLAAINWDKVKALVDGLNYMGAILRKIDEWSAIKIPDWLSAPNLLKKQSFEGNGIEGGRLQPINFNPSNQKQVLQPIQMELKIDGRTMAEAMSEVLEDIYNHPRGAAAPNGWDNFTSADSNYTST